MLPMKHIAYKNSKSFVETPNKFMTQLNVALTNKTACCMLALGQIKLQCGAGILQADKSLATQHWYECMGSCDQRMTSLTPNRHEDGKH